MILFSILVLCERMVEIQDGGSHEQEIVIYEPVCNVAAPAQLFDGCTHAFKVDEFN